MSDCFLCQRPLGDENVYEAKVRAVQTLRRISVERNILEHQRLLENVENIRVHRNCYTNYVDLRRSIDNLVRRNADENNENANEAANEEENVSFDVVNKCFFCEQTFPTDQTKLRQNKRCKIISLRYSETAENIQKILRDRNDDISRTILQRIKSVPEFATSGARYHAECSRRYVYHQPVMGSQKGRPTGNRVDDSMNYIFEKLN